MKIADQVSDRIIHLGSMAAALTSPKNKVTWETAPEAISKQCEEWVTSALAVLEAVVPDHLSIYRRRADIALLEFSITDRINRISGILSALLSDINAGIVGVEAQVQAELFDDFLTTAKYALGRKDGLPMAGVMASVVFEDTIRRILKRRKIEVGPHETLDSLITCLRKADAIDDVTAARCRASAALRNKATHANWDGFDKNAVEATIELATELVGKHFK